MEFFTLSKLFDGSARYFIPGYQRGYSWKQKQIDDFFRDIDLISDSHYTGIITVKKLEDDFFELVDDQQRLTTAILTVSALIHAKKNESKAFDREFISKKYIKNNSGPILSYEDDSDSEYLQKILGGSRLVSSKRLNVYRRNILEAAALIKKYVLDMSQEEIDIFFVKMTSKMHFHCYEIKSDQISYQMFESINFRGVDLKIFEVLKNRLMSISYLIYGNEIQSHDALKLQIKNSWTASYAALGLNAKIINEDSFLRIHSLYYHNIQNSSVEEVVLNENLSIINARKGLISYTEIFDYAESIERASKLYAWMKSDFIKIKELRSLEEQIEKNRRIGYGNFEALILCSLEKFILGKIDSQKIDRLLKCCERYCFLVFGLVDKRRDHKKSHHNKLAHELFTETSAIEKVVELIENSINDADGEYINFNTIAGVVQSRFHSEGGYYSNWRIELKYLLAEWEEFNGVKISDIDEFEIEHIFPQDPKGEALMVYSEWYKEGIEDFFINDIGNLALIERDLNKEALNHDFNIKKNVYKKTALLKDVKKLNGWSKNEITNRGKKIIDFIWTRWNFPLNKTENYDENQLLAIAMKGVKR